jgi:hypothetical protein
MTQSACHDAHVPEPKDSDREVLTSLPRSRPVRRSAKRGDRPVPQAAARASTKPVGPRKPPPVKTATGTARSRDTPRRKVPAAGYAAPDGRAGEPTASAGAELISTTIQAAAELAQIGLSVGRQTLQSMLDRLPKP